MKYSTKYTALKFKVMERALRATGRPILYSLCNWGTSTFSRLFLTVKLKFASGVDQVWTWGNATGNSWRMSNDIGFGTRESHQCHKRSTATHPLFQLPSLAFWRSSTSILSSSTTPTSGVATTQTCWRYASKTRLSQIPIPLTRHPRSVTVSLPHRSAPTLLCGRS